LQAVAAAGAVGSHLAKHKNKTPDTDTFFVQKHKSVLDKLASVEVNNLTPLDAMNLLNQIKNEIGK
jgi:hypothetical protein